MVITYLSASCTPRVGVPPESIWVVSAGSTGNAKFNDKAASTFADDSTNASGQARITIPSFSGCGSVTLRLFVAGVDKGTKTVQVRTTDTNADGRVTSADQTGPCDVNYNSTADDATIVSAHADHWRRNALHGTLVRRTSFCETCPPEAVNTKGDSEISWSASARYLSITAFIDAGPGNEPACKVFLVPSSPSLGNELTQFTFTPILYHDYDPNWSPLNTEIIFDRGDSVVIRKPVPWLGTTETVVTASNNPGCDIHHGDNMPGISPDGQWVAFARCNGNPTGGWSLWKKKIVGGTATQLTPTAARVDFYPQWSPDGQTIYFQRIDDTIGPQWTLWKVPANGGTATQVFIPPSSPDIYDAVQPAASPDGLILTAGFGKRDSLVRNVVTHTLDPALSSPTSAKLIPNYPDTNFADKGDFPILSPRLSPDGTRLLLGSKQAWAARRNMNLPPRFTTVTSFEEGTRSIADTAATMNFTFDPHSSNFITVLATDTESDALTYKASFLQSWMTWNPSTRTLTASNPIPSGNIGKTFYVKFWVTTASGGTDSFIAIITVAVTFAGPARSSGSENESLQDGPNPTRGAFAVTAPFELGAEARLSVFDISGRLVARVRGPSGTPIVWEGKDRYGAAAPSGTYLWRLEVGAHRQEGKIVVVR